MHISEHRYKVETIYYINFGGVSAKNEK